MKVEGEGGGMNEYSVKGDGSERGMRACDERPGKCVVISNSKKREK